MKDVYDQAIAELRGMWRFRKWVVVTTWLVCLVGWSIVLALPDMYRASARFQVDTSSTLEPLLGTQIVAANVEQQLAMVRQALVGSVQLLKVATETGLDAGVETDAQRVELVAGLGQRLSISADSLSTPGQGRPRGESLFTIEYEDRDRSKAAEVVSVLLNTFIEDTLRSERAGNESARKFIEQQIAETEQRLQEAEDLLARFKRDNADKLPGSEGGYFTRLQRTRDALAESRRSLRIAQSKRDRLRLQISGEVAVVTSTDRDADDLPANSLDARIRDYESRLESLLLDYTERHPDVIAVQETLLRLKAERADELQKLGLQGGDIEIAMLDANPVHQAIRIALNETDVEIATLEADIADQVSTVSSLKALIDEVPEVEAEYARLNRDYEVVREGYQALVESRETQVLSSRAYDSGEEDFKIIDPPVAGFNPVSPNRTMLFLAVAILAGAAGVGFAFAFSQLSPVVHDVNTLRKVAGIPVLGKISVVAGQGGFFGRADFKQFVASLAGVVVILGTLVVLEISGHGVRDILVGLL
ncbi:MAG: hypothetical protein K0U72_15220 [Gammaproteobacteria bacterium]|nr:hypothetical protein [Gammaproteobacteria bacterium]